MKDNKTLEYYRVDANSTLKLQLKPKMLDVHLCVVLSSVSANLLECHLHLSSFNCYSALRMLI